MIHNTVLGLILTALAATSVASMSDNDQALSLVDGRAEITAHVAKALWQFAELGYQEKRSSALLQETLRKQGFAVKADVAGMPTAFVATAGSGHPVIAVLAEYDALPGLSQDSVPSRSPIPGKGAAHACGHNLFAAGSITAALAIKQWLGQSKTPGTVRVYGTPAEEGGSGKVYLVRDGQFSDVDFVLHWHPGSANTAAAESSIAVRSAKFRFHGIAAHAAFAAHLGRSALDGVEAFDMMVNLMREHVPEQTRIHYVITDGGQAPNVVPEFAEVYYYLRHPDVQMVRDLWKRLEAAAQGAAQGTGTTVNWEIIHGNYPLLINETLAKMVDAKLRLVGGVNYDRSEREFADKIRATLQGPQLPADSQERIQPYKVTLGFGSTDVGDVSVAVPTVGFETATWVPGTSGHTWQAAAISGTSIGVKGARVAAKTLTLTAIELFQNSELRAAARAEFEQRRGNDFKYESLVGDRAPPLEYRKMK